MIPEAAVEAAALSIHRAHPFQSLSICRAAARAALEAAAPYMLAGAWDEAIQDADDEGYLYTHQSDYMKKRNPYRLTP